MAGDIVAVRLPCPRRIARFVAAHGLSGLASVRGGDMDRSAVGSVQDKQDHATDRLEPFRLSCRGFSHIEHSSAWNVRADRSPRLATSQCSLTREMMGGQAKRRPVIVVTAWRCPDRVGLRQPPPDGIHHLSCNEALAQRALTRGQAHGGLPAVYGTNRLYRRSCAACRTVRH